MSEQIDPGPGYRLLGPDEVIQEGDEFWNQVSDQWEHTNNPGRLTGVLDWYRRRTGWQKVSPTCLPEANRPCWVRTPWGDTQLFSKGFRPLVNHIPAFTHFHYCEGSYQIPPPPEPEKSKEDEAFEKAVNALPAGRESMRLIFQAGIDFARKEKAP